MTSACSRSSAIKVSFADIGPDTISHLGRRLVRVEHAFGLEADFALGIEEELLLVDERDFRPANIASQLVESLNPERGAITNDLYEALIECSTPVVSSAPEGLEHLA